MFLDASLIQGEQLMKIFKTVATTIAAAAVLALPVKSFAVPTLQLDIAGGTYDTTTQTIVASGNPFTLYALIVPDTWNTLSDTYYISAALAPKVSTASSLGSFVFNGTTVNATSDMLYGTPPVETLQSHQAGDLQQHGIYDTYFKQFAFNFSSSNQISQYNTADRATAGTAINLTPNSSGGMYFAAFTVDTALLDPAYVVHFDLYNSAADGSNVYITQFAPFSHDAESGGNGNQVPEPSTLLLIGSGLTGLGFMTRKLRKA